MELTTKQENMPAVLDGYVKQGQFFLMSAAQNLIQYGRVLTEAKPLVPHGQFENWVRENFNMSQRSAQNYMSVWARFGGNERLQGIQFSNLQKMLSLPEGTEEAFAEENNIADMTAKEVEAAVKKVRQEADRQIRREREAKEAAEQRAKAAELKQAEPDRGLIAQLAEKDAEIRTAQRAAQRAEEMRSSDRAELESLRRDLRETEEMLAENQEEYNRIQAELLNAKSTIARGDAERTVSQQLTAEGFAASVRAFLGSAAQLPYMSGTFAQITDPETLRQWDEHLQAVEDFCIRARKAMNREGVVIDA